MKYSRNQLYPQLDVFGSYGINGAGDHYTDAVSDLSAADRPFYSAGARISLPLGNISARNNFRSSKAAQTQAVLTVKRLEQSIMIQIDTAVKQAKSNFERVDATKKARQFAEDALDAETRKLLAGKSTGFEVLRLQRDLTTARGNEIQALATYNRALSQLSLFEGSTLQRRGIDLTVK